MCVIWLHILRLPNSSVSHFVRSVVVTCVHDSDGDMINITLTTGVCASVLAGDVVYVVCRKSSGL